MKFAIDNWLFTSNAFDEYSLDSEACQQNKVPDSWAVGDQKIMIINGAEYAIDIIGKNHDTYTGGAGAGIAPLTFQLHDCYGTKYRLNDTQGNYEGWSSSAFRRYDVPKIIAAMPPVVQAALHAVVKRTGGGSTNPEFRVMSDKMFLLAEVEIFGTTNTTHEGEGSQYAYYAAGGSTIKKLNGVATNWWERSPNRLNNESYGYVKATGAHANGNPYTNQFGVAPAFCF